MGTDKATLVRPDGRTQLQFTFDCISACTCRVAIAGGDSSDLLDAVPLPDPVEYQGPITGLISGLTYAHSHDYAAILTLPVDLPNITAADLLVLCARWHENPHVITLATGEAPNPEPLIGVYPVAYLDPLRRCAAGESRSIKRWLEKQDVSLVPLDPRSLSSANTPAEFRHAFEP